VIIDGGSKIGKRMCHDFAVLGSTQSAILVVLPRRWRKRRKMSRIFTRRFVSIHISPVSRTQLQ
jgi:hypothetical protein